MQAESPQSSLADTEISRAAVPVRAVVELFTSQGCSSCPRADALLSRLAKRNDIIVLSFPVDYWDYLGWKDTLARPKFSERQRIYSKARGDGAIYTPQAVVNGLVHINGGDEPGIEQTIDTTDKTIGSAHVDLHLAREHDRLIVEVGPAATPGASPKEATLWLAVISSSVTVPIARGENEGRTVTYSNVVRELIPIGMWHGKAMTVQFERHSFMRADADACAVFLQQGRAGAIVSASLMRQF